MRTRFVFVIVLTMIVSAYGVGYSSDATLRAEGLCYEIENAINALVDYTTTKCMPGAGKQKGTIGFILISEKPIFSVEASKKAWLIVVVGAVGKTMRDNPSIKIGEVIVSDSRLMKNHKAFWFPGSLAKTLQSKAYSGEISLEQLYQQTNDNLKELNIPERK